ncbi:hypothetical protein XA68_11747 [Ophiocordyceps unilateralis]|uniref:Uncharacterized protein n=1 Tax=Ophiocordyceps unilateralis TaxID=268505 RepID=A0A2A9PER6_OPHUN|nr:hypothetical protein XA68_11747 [Ophiocordyceps unilateralis]
MAYTVDTVRREAPTLEVACHLALEHLTKEAMRPLMWPDVEQVVLVGCLCLSVCRPIINRQTAHGHSIPDEREDTDRHLLLSQRLNASDNSSGADGLARGTDGCTARDDDDDDDVGSELVADALLRMRIYVLRLRAHGHGQALDGQAAGRRLLQDAQGQLQQRPAGLGCQVGAVPLPVRRRGPEDG